MRACTVEYISHARVLVHSFDKACTVHTKTVALVSETVIDKISSLVASKCIAITKKRSSMTSFRERVIKMHPLMEDLVAIMEHDESNDASDVQMDLYRKSDSKAEEFIQTENAFASLAHERALEFCNKRIRMALPNSYKLHLAYAERASILWAHGSYEYCLLDLNRALNNAPKGEDSKIKKLALMEERHRCWKQLVELHRRKQDIQREMGSYWLRQSDISPMQRYCLSSSRLYYHQADPAPEDLNPRDPVWNIEFGNALLPNVSHKVRIEQNETHGRHLIATEDIETGEILSVQDYFSTMTLRNLDRIRSFCDYCTSWCQAQIPCLTCTEEMYCSLHCRESAYQSYHRTECKLLPFLHLPEPAEDAARLDILFPLRIFLIGTKQGANLTTLMNDPKVFEILDGKSNCVGVTHKLNDYFAMLNLPWKGVPRRADTGNGGYCGGGVDGHTRRTVITSSKESEISSTTGNITSDTGNFYPNLPKNSTVSDSIKTIFSALKSIGFFDVQKEESQIAGRITDAEVFAILLLLHHFLVIKQNRGSRTNVFFDPHSIMMETSLAFGDLTDFMNKSCDANTRTFSRSRRSLTYSLRPIKAGQLWYDCSFAVKSLVERQKYVKEKHDAVCHCHACTHDWPMEESLLRMKVELLPSKESMMEEIRKTCDWCKNLYDTLGDGQHIDKEEDLRTFLRLNENIRQYVKEPSPLTYICEDYIQTVMYKKGNYHIHRDVVNKFLTRMEKDESKL